MRNTFYLRRLGLTGLVGALFASVVLFVNSCVFDLELKDINNFGSAKYIL
jgi:hypothetical protein